MPRAAIALTTEPMYATVGQSVPPRDGWTFEPKFDGMRVLAHVTPRSVKLVTRNGRQKQAQFPEIVEALRALGAQVELPLVLDGEVVALERNRAGRFQALQSRMHLQDRTRVSELARTAPAALYAFDLLQLGSDALTTLPWSVRRDALEQLLDGTDPRDAVRLTHSSRDVGRMLRRAQRNGWEGLIAKRVDARYRPGARSTDWLKLKLQYRAEFVVGGYTEPRNSREHLGALLLGYHDEKGGLVYAGHMGGGFDRASLREMYERLAPLERKTAPFTHPPRTNEPAHWVAPRVVVEVKFAEWTSDGRLRQPIYVGTREDKRARDVTREAVSLQEWRMPTRSKARPRAGSTARKRGGAGGSIIDQLDRIEADGGDGELTFGRGKSLQISSLGKLYFPDAGITKGDVMRHYATVAPMMLPHLKDRPLAVTRHPEGIAGHSFYQQNAPEGTPDGVRVEEIAVKGGDEAPRFIGGDLLTLLHLVQMGGIVIHTWFSRIDTLDEPDLALIDLDPGEGVEFSTIVQVAREVRAVTDELGLSTVVKTSGSRGMHVGIPLPRGVDYATSAELAKRIARDVVRNMPAVATLERLKAKRPRGTILVDVNQNARGKTMVAPYAVRAKPHATVSAPLDWKEVTGRLAMERFTVRTMPRRVAQRGDLWTGTARRRNTARAITAALESS